MLRATKRLIAQRKIASAWPVIERLELMSPPIRASMAVTRRRLPDRATAVTQITRGAGLRWFGLMRALSITR